VRAPDGEELDAYVLGVFEPLEEFVGECIAVIRRLDDNENKLVLVPEGKKILKRGFSNQRSSRKGKVKIACGLFQSCP